MSRKKSWFARPTVRVGRHEVPVTRVSLARMFETLRAERGRVVSPLELYRASYQRDPVDTEVGYRNIVQLSISKLRRDLGKLARHLVTFNRVGYAWKGPYH